IKPPRKVRRSTGYVWEVRYREGSRHRSRVFDRKADAEDFQAEVRRRKRLGTLTHLHAGDQLLADFGVEWWRLHARPNLQESTLRRYSSMWDRHVLPHLGRYRLKEITPAVVEHPQTNAADRGLGVLRPREVDEDQRHPQRPPAGSTQAGPGRVAAGLRAAPRRRLHLRPAGRRPLAQRRLPQLAQACLRARREGSRTERTAPLRPTPLLRLATDQRGRFDRRGGPPGRPLPGGVPAHLRAHLRGVRP